MTQPSLFDTPAPEPKPLVCAFGTAWLAHFRPPMGTGSGCVACETGLATLAKGVPVSASGRK